MFQPLLYRLIVQCKLGLYPLWVGGGAVREGGWVSGCMVLGCWLGSNHDMWTITPLFCCIGIQKVVFDYYDLSPVSTKLSSGFWTASQLAGGDKLTSVAALTLLFAPEMKPVIFFLPRRFRGQYIHRRVKLKQPSPVCLSVISLSSSQHVNYCLASCWMVRVLSGYEENTIFWQVCAIRERQVVLIMGLVGLFCMMEALPSCG